MTSRERVLAHLAGQPVDRLPLMPITMMFACAQIGARYRDYCTDYRVLVEGQIRTAEAFGFDYVNTMSDPAREAADCGAVVEYFDNQPVALVEDQALLADKEVSLKDFRKDVHIDVFNEAGQKAISYHVFRAWVSEYQPLPDLDANANAVAISHIKLECEGWIRDPAVTEPTEPSYDDPA